MMTKKPTKPVRKKNFHMHKTFGLLPVSDYMKTKSYKSKLSLEDFVNEIVKEVGNDTPLSDVFLWFDHIPYNEPPDIAYSWNIPEEPEEEYQKRLKKYEQKLLKWKSESEKNKEKLLEQLKKKQKNMLKEQEKVQKIQEMIKELENEQ